MSSWVLRELRSIDGLEARISDGDLNVRAEGGDWVRFHLRQASWFSFEDAKILTTGQADAGAPILLAAKTITGEARSVLADAGLSWLERKTGACRIQAAGVLVDRSGGSLPGESGLDSKLRRPTKLLKKSGLVAETLLLSHLEGEIHVRETADEAGVSKMLVSAVLRRLEQESVVESRGAHAHKKRKLANARKLLDLWRDEENADGWRRQRLYIWSQTPEALFSNLTKLTDEGLDWALGHAAAANHYAPHLTHQPDPEIWIREDIPVSTVADVLDGEVVESGANLTVWQCTDDTALHHIQAFSQEGDDTRPMVSPYRAYVESYHQGGRFRDLAGNLREKFDLPGSAPSA